MFDILTLGAIRQLCVVGSYLACAVARASDAEAVAYAFESAAKGIEGAEELRGIHAPPAVVQRIARRQIKRIEDSCEKWLASDLGVNWRKNPDAEAMLAALEHVLPACLPGPDGFATADIIASRIVEAALLRAAALDPKDPTFAKGGIGHNVLRSLLAGSIAALEHDTEFRDYCNCPDCANCYAAAGSTKKPPSGGSVNCWKRSRVRRASRQRPYARS